jgi:hypothetical protein
MAVKKLYKLTDGDRAIFAKVKQTKDPNWFFDYYLRGPDSGTWWRPVEDQTIKDLKLKESKEVARRWQEGYEKLYDIWRSVGQPEFFAPVGNAKWVALTDTQFHELDDDAQRTYRAVDQDELVFHHHHGLLMLDWQKLMYQSKHPLQVVVGGFGSAKTWGKALIMLLRAAMLPGYRAFALAPFGLQAEEVYNQIKLIIANTLYEERFLLGAPTQPNKMLKLGNSMVGNTSIECYPVKDDIGKILTLTGDEAMYDQAEQEDDFTVVIRHVGTRFRGTVRGRPRVGQLTFVANSAENPELWERYDEAEEFPARVWAYSPTTFENVHLTIPDLIRYEGQVGTTQEEHDQHLRGKRPMGSGEHFPAASLTACRAHYLDAEMASALEAKKPKFIILTAPKVDVYKWEMPPDPKETYATVADPGWSNPPARNSPAVSVWAIGKFPATPLVLRAFSWVFGNGSPNPWIAQYTDYVFNYKSSGLNGFDSTGWQKGYDRLTNLQELVPMPVNMDGGRKFQLLTLTKKFAADGLYQVPYIPHIFGQMSRYKLPDDKLRQDLVSMLLVLTAVVEPIYYAGLNQLQPAERTMDQEDRHERILDDRYSRD